MEGATGFFGFPALDIFEIGFCTQNPRFFGFGIHRGFQLFPFSIFGFHFVLIKSCFSVFANRLSSSYASSIWIIILGGSSILVEILAGVLVSDWPQCPLYVVWRYRSRL